MRTPITWFFIAFFMSTFSYAQTTENKANEWMKQAESNLKQKEYTKARYLFKMAYSAFAAQDKYAKAIECGTQTASLYSRENYYKEAFELCREMDQVILAAEQKQQRNFYDQRYEITKERLQMYMRLKSVPQAKAQLDRLEELAGLAKNDSLSTNLLYTQANYYYTFGLTSQGDACTRKLISEYKEKKEYDKVTEVYRNMIEMAKRNNNASLASRTYEHMIIWTDSVKSLRAQDEFNILKRKYDDSLRTIEKKESSLSTKQYTIIGLCVLIAILVAALVVLGIILLRFIAGNHKLKKGIQIANEHNELKTGFIQNISAQMEPALNTISDTAGSLIDQAPVQSQQMQAQIDALKQFSNDIQELSALENSLTVLYPLSEVNAYTFCENTITKVQDQVHPGVSLTVNAAKLGTKINPEQLERVLLHLLQNAALYTKEGHITLEFKKRGAHTHQFIVTDSGPGITEELQDNLFKPFSSVKDLTQGDGMGLPICSLIVTKMNGSLALDKTFRKGTRFILELHV